MIQTAAPDSVSANASIAMPLASEMSATSTMPSLPVGQHCILELFGCDPALLNDENHIRDGLTQAANEGMSTLLNLSSYKFEPQGVTALALLAESHISIHTWPEHGYAAVDVFTCGDHAKPQQACEYLVQWMNASEYAIKTLPRGSASAMPLQQPVSRGLNDA